MATSNQTVDAINKLSAQFETSYRQLSDKYTALADSAGASSATLQTNNIQTQGAIAQAEEATVSASKTKNLAIGALAIVLVIAAIFWLKK